MATTTATSYSTSIHRLHAAVLAGTSTLVLGAAICDIAYSVSYEIQWINFASWLIVGGLVTAGFALLLSVVDLRHAERRARGAIGYTVLLLATWVMGLLNALVHARDAWATMPSGLVLSIVSALMVCMLTWFRFASLQSGVIK